MSSTAPGHYGLGTQRQRGRARNVSLSVNVSLILTLALSLASCGTSEEAESGIPTDFPTIASVDLDGIYEIVSVEPSLEEATRVTFTATPTVEIDVVTGSLTVDTACNRYLGSFSLDDDGRASFTVTGGTSDECLAEVEAQDNQLLEVLTATGQWIATDDGLVFEGEAGSMSWTRS